MGNPCTHLTATIHTSSLHLHNPNTCQMPQICRTKENMHNTYLQGAQCHTTRTQVSTNRGHNAIQPEHKTQPILWQFFHTNRVKVSTNCANRGHNAKQPNPNFNNFSTQTVWRSTQTTSTGGTVPNNPNLNFLMFHTNINGSTNNANRGQNATQP